MSVGVLTPDTLVGARYASRSLPRTLYHSNDVEALRHIYPDFEDLQLVPGDAHAVMSEPLGDAARGVERGSDLNSRPRVARKHRHPAVHSARTDSVPRRLVVRELGLDGAVDVAVQMVGSDPVDDAVSLEHGQDVWLHPGEPKRRSLRVDELVDLGELFGAL